MNVFVLCTGRCGSVTFIRACEHATNFSAGHETRTRMTLDARLDYPAAHIEADNRLSWVLGRLQKNWGARDDVFYVHLKRDREATARSFALRLEKGTGIIAAYKNGVLMGARGADPLDICRDYVDTVTANIELFLADKPNVMTINLEAAIDDFPRFWRWAGLEGDLSAALREWEVRHNASRPA
jgi:hypothetical protein